MDAIAIFDSAAKVAVAGLLECAVVVAGVTMCAEDATEFVVLMLETVLYEMPIPLLTTESIGDY